MQAAESAGRGLLLEDGQHLSGSNGLATGSTTLRLLEDLLDHLIGRGEPGTFCHEADVARPSMLAEPDLVRAAHHLRREGLVRGSLPHEAGYVDSGLVGEDV